MPIKNFEQFWILVFVGLVLVFSVLSCNEAFASSPLFPSADRQVQIYFGEKYEPITHFGIHFLIATWRPKYSLIAAVSIETADTLGGRFELKDWVSRLSGCIAGYLVKRFIFKRR